MASSNTNRLVRENIDRVLKHDRTTMISRPKWGELSFEDARTDIEQVFDIADTLKALPTENLPEVSAQQVSQTLSNVAIVLDQIDTFSVNNSNPQGIRNQLITNLRGQQQGLFQAAATYIPYLAYQKGDIAKNIAALSEKVREAQDIRDAALKDAKVHADEINGIVTRAREASASAGVAVFTQDFRENAKALEKDARRWLWTAAICAILTIAVAGCMWYWAEPKLDSGQLLQKATTKLFVLALLVTATLWCGRNYKALKHLATINRHRALSIQTFQAFSSAAADSSTKDAVLLEATRAVFGNVPTGYIEGSGEGDLKVLEIARSVLPHQDKG